MTFLKRMTLVLFVCSAAALSLYARARQPLKPRPAPSKTDKKAPEAKPTPAPEPEFPDEELKSVTIFLVPRNDGDAQKLLDALRDHPTLPITLLFPPRYFDDPGRRTMAAQFAVLQSSQIVEIGMGIENSPMLPLLADLDMAGDKVSKWGFTYAWPEDVAAHVARSSSRYQKRWGTLPGGFYPPYESLSEEVVQILKKFRLNWVLGRPSDSWGVRFYGGTALLVPPKPPAVDELADGSKAWADKMVEWCKSYP